MSIHTKSQQKMVQYKSFALSLRLSKQKKYLFHCGNALLHNVDQLWAPVPNLSKQKYQKRKKRRKKKKNPFLFATYCIFLKNLYISIHGKMLHLTIWKYKTIWGFPTNKFSLLFATKSHFHRQNLFFNYNLEFASANKLFSVS